MFITGDVTVGGPGGVKTGTVTGGLATYSVAVTGMTTSGTVVASIVGGARRDIAARNNRIDLDRQHGRRDSVAPTVTINQAGGQPTLPAPA